MNTWIRTERPDDHQNGPAAVNMIPVEDYNEAVAQYTSKNLDPHPDGLLSSPETPKATAAPPRAWMRL